MNEETSLNHSLYYYMQATYITVENGCLLIFHATDTVHEILMLHKLSNISAQLTPLLSVWFQFLVVYRIVPLHTSTYIFQMKFELHNPPTFLFLMFAINVHTCSCLEQNLHHQSNLSFLKREKLDLEIFCVYFFYYVKLTTSTPDLRISIQINFSYHIK